MWEAGADRRVCETWIVVASRGEKWKHDGTRCRNNFPLCHNILSFLQSFWHPIINRSCHKLYQLNNKTGQSDIMHYKLYQSNNSHKIYWNPKKDKGVWYCFRQNKNLFKWALNNNNNKKWFCYVILNVSYTINKNHTNYRTHIIIWFLLVVYGTFNVR